jgi:hypothetical protein
MNYILTYHSTNLNERLVSSIWLLLIPDFFANTRQFTIYYRISCKILFAVSTFT